MLRVTLDTTIYVSELVTVLRDDFAWEAYRLHFTKEQLAKLGNLVTPKKAIDAIKEDPDDNRILECAVAGNAGLIVSGDRHLTRLESFRGIGIVRPVNLLRTLGV